MEKYMRCEKAQELFSDYCDGTIQNAMRVPLENHINECTSCKKEIEELRAVWHILDSAPVIDPPASLRAMVWQKINTEKIEQAASKRENRLFTWKNLLRKPVLAWGAAAILILMLATITMPGKFIPAGFPNPFSYMHILSHRAAQYNPVVSMHLQPEVAGSSEQMSAIIVLHNSTSEPIKLELRFVGDSASAARNQYTLSPGEHINVSIPVQVTDPGSAIPFMVSWDIHGKPYSKNYLLTSN
jgi:hypothetical protein